MKSRIIKDKEHIIYDNIDELRQVMPDKKIYQNWRNAPLWSWTLTDDGQVCQIIDKGTFNNKEYIVEVKYRAVDKFPSVFKVLQGKDIALYKRKTGDPRWVAVIPDKIMEDIING